MSYADGEVRFKDGAIKHFKYNGNADICVRNLFDTYDEMLEKWEKICWNECTCKPTEKEEVEIYSSYGCGFHWKGTACRKCMVITSGADTCEDNVRIIYEIPEWAEKSYEVVE